MGPFLVFKTQKKCLLKILISFDGIFIVGFKNMDFYSLFFSKMCIWIAVVVICVSVGVESFTCPQYPEYCKCQESSVSGNRTECEGQELTQIQTIFPENVKILKLQNTRVASIPPGLPESLKELSIDH